MVQNDPSTYQVSIDRFIVSIVPVKICKRFPENNTYMYWQITIVYQMIESWLFQYIFNQQKVCNSALGTFLLLLQDSHSLSNVN